MLAKYPVIQTLMGPEKKTKYIVFVLIILQLALAYFTRYLPWGWWLFSIYFFGATVSHSLYSALHELTHNLVFRSKKANHFFALFLNLPIGIPVAFGFKKYHFLHHNFLGDAKKDVDIPLKVEARIFRYSIGKFFWLLIQPFTYTVRPFIKFPLKITKWELVNIFLQIMFGCLIVYVWGWKSFNFLIISSLISMSLHPLALHLITEHYLIDNYQESYSYYGPMNYLTFNVGYHVEHHDFPSIPWSKIKMLKKIAPEYYSSLHYHSSWFKSIKKFVFSKKINLFSRIIRD